MASGSTETDTDLRLLLIGRTGHGKSETGNSILGYKAFVAKNSSDSVTKECDWKTAEHDGKRVEIVDTPGLKDTVLDEAHIKRELYRAMILSLPGFHAIALVIKPGRFTPEMKQVVDVFFDFFGGDVHKFAFVIFTFTDTQKQLMNFLEIHDDGREQPLDDDAVDFTVNDELKAALTKNGYTMNKTLKELIDKCGGNIAIINNNTKNETQKKQQVQAILSEIHKMKRKTGNSYFTNETFLTVDRMLQIEHEKATMSKEQNAKHVPWSWIRAENDSSQFILEKVLQDVKDKEIDNNIKRKKELESLKSSHLTERNALEEELKNERIELEKKEKELEATKLESKENVLLEREKWQTKVNELEKEEIRKEFEVKEQKYKYDSLKEEVTRNKSRCLVM